MYEPHGLDGKDLRTHLENYRLIASVNMYLFDQNVPVKEELAIKLELAQGYLNELHEWEKLGDVTKSDIALKNANRIMMEIKEVVQRILAEDNSWDDPQHPGSV